MSETGRPSLLQPRNSWAVFSVVDVRKALEFYQDKLGIPFDLVVEDEIGQISYIGSPLNLHFTTGKPFLYMVVEGIEELYDDDGNIMRFGRDIPED
jgi:hypothetical protein